MYGNFCGRFIEGLAKNLIKVKPQLPQCSKIVTRRKHRSVVYPSSHSNRYKPVNFAYELFLPAKATNDELPPIIFLHGMTTSKEWSFGDLSQTIADRTKRKAYSLDARNHGDSGWCEEFSFDLNVEDLLHFMDEVRIPKAVIVGHSMGAYTGYRAAAKAPERIATLFAEEMFVAKVPQAVTDIFLDLPKLWIEVEDFIPPGLEIEEAEHFITEYVRSRNPSLVPPKNGRDDPLGLCHLLKKDPSGRVAFRANLKVIQKNASNIGSIMSELKGVYEGPTYIIYGSKSPFEIHKHKESIRKHFPKAVFLEFGRAGHFVHKKCPKEYTEKVVKYILENEK